MGLALVAAMTAPIHYATFSRGARNEFRTSANELMDALWAGYKHASGFFMANPTTEAWHALVRATAWRVAFLVEGRS